MVHIYLKHINGFRSIYDGADWSEVPSDKALYDYYEKNKKQFKEGYKFTIEGITLEVRQITEKSKQQIVFST